MQWSKRQVIKTGSQDTESTWAKASLAIMLQFCDDMRTKKSSLIVTIFVDEHSEFFILAHGGHHGKAMLHEWKAPLDSNGNWCPEEEGGVVEPLRKITRPKNEKRADGCFGVCTPMMGGQRRGLRMKPFRYNNKVVGVAKFEKEIQKAIGNTRETVLSSRQRCERDPKSHKNVRHNHADTPNTLESRLGVDFRNKLPKSVKVVCITEIMDHVVAEGNRLFKGTEFENTWKIYHDALPQWWEAGAQEHLARLGFNNRHWWANKETDKNIAKKYWNKIMGDSPNLMPLDYSLFNNLIEAISMNVVATAGRSKNMRYSMGTPDSAWRTMVEVWEKAHK